MAWRPTKHLLEGELDNTTPGKVTGWMRFAGMDRKVTFDLKGNFHRDIRGAKVRLHGRGQEPDPRTASYWDGIAAHQTGDVGDMTAGREPVDYVPRPYFEWYGDRNGRVVIEVDAEQVEVIGQPIPACESDPISRDEQAQHMARFLAGVSAALQAPTRAVGGPPLASDPAFSHWVMAAGRIVGEARDVEPAVNGVCSAFVRLFNMPECAEYGSIESQHLCAKAVGLPGAAGSGTGGAAGEG